MDTVLALLAAVPQPFSIDDARDLHIERRTVTRLAAAGALQRVDRGAYVPAALWDGASAEQRHLLRCRAVLRRYDAAVLSHVSAVVALALPTYGADLDTVHLSRLRPGRSGSVAPRHRTQLHPQLTSGATIVVDGMASSTAAVAALQVADWDGLRAGLIAAEAALHRGICTRDDLRHAREIVRLGRGRANADTVVRLAGAASESPGETLTRLLLHVLGIHATQQVEIRLPGGGIARVDFLLDDLGVVVEFDGRVKYEGADGRRALVREKRREDGLRALGLAVVRLTWPDLGRPRHVAALISAAAQRRTRDANGADDRSVRVPRATFRP